MAAGQPIPESVRREAARWIAERDADMLTPDDEVRRAAWIAADPAHAAAFAQLSDVWTALGHGDVRRGMEAGRGPIPARRSMAAARWPVGAIAACLMLMLAGSLLDWPTRLRADIVTAAGERRKIQLQDGSTVQLNTDSAIAIAYRADRRTVRLLKGEAAFDVATDRRRPFTVAAEDGTTTALGTRFIVKREDAGIDIVVTEHRVRVSWPSGRLAVRGSVVVGEGRTMRYGARGVVLPHAVDIMESTAWTRGKLMFVDRPLAEVVTELDRYHPGYVRVIGADLARRRVSGVFPVDDPLGALDAIQRSLRIGSLRLTDRLIFLHD